MPLKTEKDLDESSRNLWLKAVAAIEVRNFDYAVSLLRRILKQEPEFLKGRQLLRRAEIVKHKAQKKPLFRIPSPMIAIMKAQRVLKTDPRRAVEMIEEILESEPCNRQANLALKQAALKAGWPETAIFALQTLLEENARETRILHELGQLYHELGASEKEISVYARIAEIDPNDAEAGRRCKEASARAAMNSGGWKKAESVRDLIKAKEAGEASER